MTGPMVVDHVGLVVADLEASRRFYAAALAPLGFTEVGRDDAGGTGYGVEAANDDFWIGPVIDSPPSRNVHVAFVAAGTAEVEAFFAAAVAAGGTPRLAPGVRPEYSERYYAAFVTDPDGNNVEAVFHAPEPITGRTAPPPASC
jgi:catechol 2,3-dioxygenase-like lactoylglutathione lyase family enzyme